MSNSVYSLYGTDAVRHLYAVVSGLDSVVLGEAEIQGQVKRAWQTAEAAGTAGGNLNPLFRQALGVGRRVRTETQVGRELTSVSEAAVALASEHLGGFAGRRIAVLGAGEMGGGMAKAIAPVRGAELVLASRSWQRAQELALMLGARAVHLDELAAELVECGCAVHLDRRQLPGHGLRRVGQGDGRARRAGTARGGHRRAPRRGPGSGRSRRPEAVRHVRRAVVRGRQRGSHGGRDPQSLGDRPRRGRAPRRPGGRARHGAAHQRVPPPHLRHLPGGVRTLRRPPRLPRRRAAPGGGGVGARGSSTRSCTSPPCA